MPTGQEVASLYGIIGLQVEGLRSGLAEAKRGLTQASQQMGQTRAAAQHMESGFAQAAQKAGRSLSALGSAAQRLTLMIGLPLLAAGAAAIKLASDVVETENLYTVSLGSMAEAGRAWSDGLQKALGLNAVEVRRSLGLWQDLFTNFGFGERKAFAMSQAMTQLAYDISSFRNVSPEEVFTRLQSGLVGETEAVRRLGVDISEAALQNYALTNGLMKAGEEMSNQQKVLLRYQIILQQTTKAQGDLARTADSPANSFRRMQNEIVQIGQAAGQIMLPAVGQALAWINNTGLPSVSHGLASLQLKWVEMSDEAQRRMIYLAALMVGGGPLLKGISILLSALALLQKGFVAAFSVPIVARFAGAIVALGVLLTAFDAAMALTVSNMGRTFEAAGKSLNETGVAMAGSVIPIIAQAGRELANFGESLVKVGQDFQQKAATTPPWWERLGKGIDVSGLMPETADFDVLQGKLEALAGRAILNPLIEQAKAWAGIRAESTGIGRDADIWAGKVASANQIVVPTVEELAAEYAVLAAKAQAAGASQVQAAQMARDALIAAQPATQMLGREVEIWGDRIKSTQGAIDANQQASRGASRAYQAQQERLSDLNDELGRAKSRLQELADVQLKGMGAMDEQSRAIDRQVKALRLQQLALFGQPGAVNRQGDLRGPAKRQYDQLQKQIEDLERRGQKIDLSKSLRFDEPLRQLKLAAEGGPRPEMDYGDALKQIKETRGRIDTLNKSIETQESAMKAAQKAMEAIAESGQALNDTLKVQQDELATAKRNYDEMTKSMQTAFGWLGDDADKLRDMGPEGKAAAQQIQSAALQYLRSVNEYVTGIADKTKTSLDQIQEDFTKQIDEALLKLAKAKAAAGLPAGSSLEPPRPGQPGSYVPPPRPERHSGGPVSAGEPYIIGRPGAEELFIPGRSGYVVPAGSGAGIGAGGLTVIGPLMSVGVIQNEADEDRLLAKAMDRLSRLMAGGQRVGWSQGVNA